MVTQTPIAMVADRSSRLHQAALVVIEVPMGMLPRFKGMTTQGSLITSLNRRAAAAPFGRCQSEAGSRTAYRVHQS